MFRGKRIDNGESVKGSLIEAEDGVFILETGNYSVLFEEPDYHSQGMGCGLEDRDITDRYDAMLHGWEKAIERVAESYPDFVEVHPESVGQYTGLKDKNGKEDWIDDIVKTKVGQFTYYRRIFQAESGAFCINLPVLYYATPTQEAIMLITCEHENVGNIHDNPELLKENKDVRNI